MIYEDIVSAIGVIGDELVRFGNSEFDNLLVLNSYSYTVLKPFSLSVPNVTQPWADEEFLERINVSGDINPGSAFKLKPIDLPFKGKFHYTYNERIHYHNQFNILIEQLINDHSTIVWLSLWAPIMDVGISQKDLPRSLGYGFQIYDGKLNMHYLSSTCDYTTQLCDDIYLAIRFLEYVSTIVNLPVGEFSHTILSLKLTL